MNTRLTIVPREMGTEVRNIVQSQYPELNIFVFDHNLPEYSKLLTPDKCSGRLQNEIAIFARGVVAGLQGS